MSEQKEGSFPYFLMLTTTLCGGLVMVVEVLGARVIGPYFGVSLYVWTALITVTLLSLSAGYALGGRLSDKHPSPAWLYGLIIAAGVLVLLVPALKPWAIQASVPLGLRGGALVSASLLFAPALLLLGCVSPYVVRIAARELASLGRTVGILYSLSTIGSMLGTALAGYLIIGFVGVSRAFHLCGALLVLIGLAYFLFYRRQWGAVGGVAALAALFWLPQPALPSVVLADGTRASLIESKDSFYGNVKVVEYAGPQTRTRELLIDGLVQGGIDQQNGQSIYEYAYLLESLPLEINPEARSALIVGLGAGVLVDRLQRRNISVDVVDIDPVVVAMAEKHFNLRLKRPVAIEDARYFLAQPGQRYDIIIMDAFSGDATPSHLLTREALERVRERLTPDGILAINVIGDARAAPLLAPAIVGTLQTQFREIAAFPLFDLADRKARGGNLVLIAANRPVGKALAARFGDVHALAQATLDLGMRQGRLLQRQPDALVLTDDFNPLDVIDIDLHENIRKTILETTPAAILLHG
jgi:predicted membrane-bound spermidine synthase